MCVVNDAKARGTSAVLCIKTLSGDSSQILEQVFVCKKQNKIWNCCIAVLAKEKKEFVYSSERKKISEMV